MRVVRSNTGKRAATQPKKFSKTDREKGVTAESEGGDAEIQAGSVAEDMDQVVSMLGDVDIDFTEGGEGATAAGPPGPAATKETTEEWPEEQPEVEEERPTSESADPVRMYLQEMGAVPLLSREDEVAIAKVVEAGEKEVRATVFALDIALQYVIGLGDALRSGEIDVRYVFGDEDTEVEDAEQRDDGRAQGFLRQVTRLKRFAAEQEKVNKELRPKKARISKARRDRLMKRRAKLAKSIQDLLDAVPAGKSHITAIVDKLKEAEQIMMKTRSFVRSCETRTGKPVAELLRAAQRVRGDGKGGTKVATGIRRMNAAQLLSLIHI